MKPLRLLAVLLLIAIAVPATAADKPRPLPKELPPYGPLAPFHAPQAQVKKLGNGLTLWLVPRPGFPKIAFAIVVRGGMAADPKDRPGLSSLLLATLDQGTKTRNAKQIAEEVQAAGGDLNGSPQSDDLIATTSFLASKAEAGLSVLADVFENATFPDSEVDLAKHNAADQLTADEADPDFLARRALAKVMFGDHPYAVISLTHDSINKTTADDLRREYARRFRPDQALLVAVGDFDPASLNPAIEKQFGGWHAPAEAPAGDPGKPAADNAHAIFFVDRAGSVQTTLAYGAFAPTRADPDYVPTEVANAIYGGMFGARLILNIREDKGYTYSPFAFLQGRRDGGLLETRADVRNAVTGASVNEIDYELNRMATTSPTEEELSRARRYLVGLQAIRMQREASVAGQLAGLWVLGLPPGELGEESEKIGKVTAAEVDQAGKKYFPFARQTVVAVGEAKVIHDQLGVLGLEIKPAP